MGQWPRHPRNRGNPGPNDSKADRYGGTMVQTWESIKKMVEKGNPRPKKHNGHQQKMNAKFHDPKEARTRYRKLANKWRKPIRKAQWKYWEETFKGSNRANIHKAMKDRNKSRSKEGLPDIKGISSCQGKWDILRDTFFAANVATPSDSCQLAWHPQKRQR